MTYLDKPFAAPAWRLIKPQWQNQPFSGEGARRVGGRWNKIGQPALYLARDPLTAMAEYYQGFPKPGMLVPYKLEAEQIIDLTDGVSGPADAAIAKALRADWKAIARLSNAVPPSWAIAEELIADGAEGAIIPSVQNVGGTNLVLWRWHDASGPGEGARLALLDPDQVLAGKAR